MEIWNDLGQNIKTIIGACLRNICPDICGGFSQKNLLSFPAEYFYSLGIYAHVWVWYSLDRLILLDGITHSITSMA